MPGVNLGGECIELLLHDRLGLRSDELSVGRKRHGGAGGHLAGGRCFAGTRRGGCEVFGWACRGLGFAARWRDVLRRFGSSSCGAAGEERLSALPWSPASACFQIVTTAAVS